ncbi:MAG: FkbM family methyltransferase [Candidatus Omnitrophica bacterium]|nr:FkbM family methyltransferase [Candidatus Omnitrophota bacterium]
MVEEFITKEERAYLQKLIIKHGFTVGFLFKKIFKEDIASLKISLLDKDLWLVENIELNAPFILRKDSAADIFTFASIFLYRWYDFPIDFRPEFIIDCGANIGCFSVLIASRFPEAKVVAIEPERENSIILEWNTKFYKNIHSIKAAIYSKPQKVNLIQDLTKREDAFRITEDEEGDSVEIVNTITIPSILKSFGYNYIDILKIDIEGSEYELFSKNYEEWLGCVKILIIEFHDRFKPGCREKVELAIKRFDCGNPIKVGENFVYYKK